MAKSDNTSAALAALRTQIDQVDDQINTLLAERSQLAAQVWEAKDGNMPVQQPDREAAVIERAVKGHTGLYSAGSIRAIMRAVIDASCDVQERLSHKKAKQR